MAQVKTIEIENTNFIIQREYDSKTRSWQLEMFEGEERIGLPIIAQSPTALRQAMAQLEEQAAGTRYPEYMDMFKLTDLEFKVMMIVTKEALDGMGGTRPAHFESDPFTWAYLPMVHKYGFNKFVVAGAFGSLVAKGLLQVNDPKKKEFFITTEGWKYMDTIWDKYPKPSISE